MHCASCVWLLEQLWRFDAGVSRTEVDLQRRTLQVDYRPDATSVRRIAQQLAMLGYEPVMDGEPAAGAVPAARRRLYQQIGVAGFAFGNIMLFSIPRYANGTRLADGFQALFDGLNLALALPVLLFSAADYFRTGWQAVGARTIAIEVPVALGLTVLFLRSAADIAGGRGPGFLDSFAGLVFFLLLGRLFQLKAFDRLAFDRSFRSFLPLAVHVERAGGLEVVPVGKLRPGDRLVLRRREIVPADARVLDADAAVDYRFLTGEETPVVVHAGERVRAGGRAACAMRVCVLREVSESELAGYWAHPLFGAHKHGWLAEAGSRFGAWFTVAAVGLAAIGALAWWPDAAASANVATAVLIVACPCALTLAAPITLGSAMGVLGRRGLYLKEAGVVLDLSRIDTVVFDKTGTLTTGRQLEVVERAGLSDRGWVLVRRLALESVASGQPRDRNCSRRRRRCGRADPIAPEAGGHSRDSRRRRGRRRRRPPRRNRLGLVHRRCHAAPRGPSGPHLRGRRRGGRLGTPRGLSAAGARGAAEALSRIYRLLLVSGDAGSEWDALGAPVRPPDVLPAVARGQAGVRRPTNADRGRRVLMVGDGLNDAGALSGGRRRDRGLATTRRAWCRPATRVIGGDRLADLPAFCASRAAPGTSSSLASLCRSATTSIGLTFALSGALTPLASAILMPVSSLTVVAISTAGDALVGEKAAAVMSVVILLIAAGGTVAAGFLVAFLWAVASGQFDDTGTPPLRMLRDDRTASPLSQDSETHDHHRR